jgi:cytochrome c-type biogenesis protein CcmH/NrfG
LREGRIDAALEAAREAVTADPSSGAAHMAVADVMVHMGRAKDAADALRAATDADPLNPEVHRLRGVVAVARGDFDEAVHSWGRFLGLAPAHTDAERIRIGLEATARLRAIVEAMTRG